MRKIVYGVTLIFITLSFSSCKEDYQVYDTKQINRIYFEQQEAEFIYGPRPDFEEDLSLKVILIGFANMQEDANFKVTPDDERSTAKYGLHYEFTEEPRFEKDSIHAYVRLNFKRENLVKDMVYTIHLNIGENDIYAPTSNSKCVVEFGDVYVPQPTWWLPDRLGTYTPEKYIMFVALYHESEAEYKELYKNIEDLWGKYLDQTDYWRHKYLLTTAVYLGYWKKKVYVPIYEHFLQTGDEAYRIPDPMNPANKY